MSDLSDIRKSHNLKRQSNEMILFLATKDCLQPFVAVVEEALLFGGLHPLGGVRFLKIKYEIRFRAVFHAREIECHAGPFYTKRKYFLL